jgi:di- and tripeptidase
VEPPRRKPLYIREGGSIPAIRFLEKEFDAPAAHFPCGQASDSAHLDKERFRLLNLYKSRDIFKKVFVDLPKK